MFGKDSRFSEASTSRRRAFRTVLLLMASLVGLTALPDRIVALPGGDSPYWIALAVAFLLGSMIWIFRRRGKEPAGGDAPSRDLPRITEGSILDPQALELLGSIIAQVAAPSERRDRGQQMLAGLLPPMQSMRHLLALAWDVLDGSPTSASRFRRELSRFAPGALQTSMGRRAAELYRSRKRPPTRPARHTAERAFRGHPLLPAARLLPVAAASVHAARTPGEAAQMLGALQLGLAGVNELAWLHDEGLRALHSGNDTGLRSALDLAFPQWPGLGGGGDPGRAFFPAGGWPGGAWLPGPMPIPPPGGAPPPGPAPGIPWPGAPVPHVPPALDLLDRFEACLYHELIPRLHSQGFGFGFLLTGSGIRYEISSIAPPHACPGDAVVMTGTGFETVEQVRFTGPGSQTIPARPTGQTATRVEVTVPEWALPGPVWLDIPERIELCHGMSTTVSRPGTPGEFLAGRARISRFELDNGRGCVLQGETATLVWAVEPGDAEVVIRRDSTEIFRGSQAAGTLELNLPDLGEVELSLVAANPHGTCPAEERTWRLVVDGPAPTLTITGAEVTQGVQYFEQHLALTSASAPFGRGHRDPNSVLLIAGKDTVVRVYVTSDRGGFAGDRARVTGFLRLRGRQYSPINQCPTGPDPCIMAGPSPQRSVTNDTLNFLIPAAEARGFDQRLIVEVFSTEGCPSFASARHVERVDWEERRALPVTIRRIQDPHTDDVVSEMDAIQLIIDAFDYLPSPATDIRLRPDAFAIQEFSAEANYCHEGGLWQLALSVAYEHNGIEGLAPDPHESIWVGVFWCNRGGMMAWPWTSTCVTRRSQGGWDAASAAHEISHCVGMGHTQSGRGDEMCENLFQPIACHYLDSWGLIEDVVFDIRRNEVQPMTWDLMSYGGPHRGPRFPHPDHWHLIRTKMDGWIAATGT